MAYWMNNETFGKKDKKVYLEESVNLSDLCKGAIMTLKNPPDYDDEPEEHANTYFEPDLLMANLRPECTGIFDDDNEEDSVCQTNSDDGPFALLAAKMTPLREDRKVLKRVIIEGTGEIVPAGALVTFQYNAYVEYNDEPFDSTYLRKSPHTAQLDNMDVIEGLGVALKSMKVEEKSQFVVHHDLAYGKLGCPPRIPPAADVLFEVVLLDFVTGDVANAIRELSVDEKACLDYESCMKAAKNFRAAGVTMFKKKFYEGAASKFELGLNALKRVKNLPNGETEEEYDALRHKMHLNLAVCANHLKQYPRACTHSRLALEIEPLSVKAKYHYSKAALGLGDTVKARRLAQEAQRLEPYNEDVMNLLEQLDTKYKKEHDEEVNMARKMMEGLGFKTVQEKEEEIQQEDEFLTAEKAAIRKALNCFGEGQMPTINLLPVSSQELEQFIKDEALKKKWLVIEKRNSQGLKYLKLEKPDVIKPSYDFTAF